MKCDLSFFVSYLASLGLWFLRLYGSSAKKSHLEVVVGERRDPLVRGQLVKQPRDGFGLGRLVGGLPGDASGPGQAVPHHRHPEGVEGVQRLAGPVGVPPLVRQGTELVHLVLVRGAPVPGHLLHPPEVVLFFGTEAEVSLPLASIRGKVALESG